MVDGAPLNSTFLWVLQTEVGRELAPFEGRWWAIWPSSSGEPISGGEQRCERRVCFEQFLKHVERSFFVQMALEVLFAPSLVQVYQPWVVLEILSQLLCNEAVHLVAADAVAGGHEKVLAHSLIHRRTVKPDKQRAAVAGQVIELEFPADKVGREIAVNLTVDHE